MRYLLDTGILLRATIIGDPLHETVDAALQAMSSSGDTFHCSTQNLAEFWRAATRPVTARNGFGLSVAEAARRLARIEEFVEVLAESIAAYLEWKRLLVAHSVAGVQVHDARIVALMNVAGIADLLTLNPEDFRRYAGLRIHTPATILAAL